MHTIGSSKTVTLGKGNWEMECIVGLSQSLKTNKTLKAIIETNFILY